MRQKTKNFAESYCLLNKSYYICIVLSVTSIHANGKNKVIQLKFMQYVTDRIYTENQYLCYTSPL